jgi:hypothetical protein
MGAREMAATILPLPGNSGTEHSASASPTFLRRRIISATRKNTTASSRFKRNSLRPCVSMKSNMTSGTFVIEAFYVARSAGSFQNAPGFPQLALWSMGMTPATRAKPATITTTSRLDSGLEKRWVTMTLSLGILPCLALRNRLGDGRGILIGQCMPGRIKS